MRDWPALALLGMTGAAMIHWLYLTAIDRLPVGIALLLEFTGPVLVALYAHVVPAMPSNGRCGWRWAWPWVGWRWSPGSGPTAASTR